MVVGVVRHVCAHVCVCGLADKSVGSMVRVLLKTPTVSFLTMSTPFFLPGSASQP